MGYAQRSNTAAATASPEISLEARSCWGRSVSKQLAQEDPANSPNVGEHHLQDVTLQALVDMQHLSGSNAFVALARPSDHGCILPKAGNSLDENPTFLGLTMKKSAVSPRKDSEADSAAKSSLDKPPAARRQSVRQSSREPAARYS